MVAGEAIKGARELKRAAQLLLSAGLIVILCGGPQAFSAEMNHYLLGVQAYRQGRMETARQYFESAYQKNPGNPDIRYYMAIVYDRLQRNGEAMLQYQYVVDHGRDDKLIRYARRRLASLQQSGGSPDNRPHVVVPLKDFRNALMVDVTLVNERNGRSARGTFIVDTGATYTSISTEMAEQLGLYPDTGSSESVRITTANGRIDVPKVYLDEVRLDGLTASDVATTVIHVRPGSSFSGLLGLSFIQQFRMTIDTENRRLVFEPR